MGNSPLLPKTAPEAPGLLPGRPPPPVPACEGLPIVLRRDTL